MHRSHLALALHKVDRGPVPASPSRHTIEHMPYAYLLRCSDDTYYAGSTWNVEARVWQHNSPDLGAAYTRRRQPVELVWCAWFDQMTEAFAFEKRIQGWNRAKREALVRGEWDALPGLSRRASVQRRASEEG